MGAGFLESVYGKALLLVLKERGLRAESQVPLKVSFRGQIVGDFFADIVVEGKVILELKAVKTLTPENSAQILNYLKATGKEVGLLVNFGTHGLQYEGSIIGSCKSDLTGIQGIEGINHENRLWVVSYPLHPLHPCEKLILISSTPKLRTQNSKLRPAK